MSDRVLVMREGGVSGVMDRGQASQESIMALAAQ
jgi:ABC-type sugar transport system ATPase subunit